jgi:hypothetical protein
LALVVLVVLTVELALVETQERQV